MPTSPYGHIEAFAAFLTKSRPGSILDIGLGNGKLGFVARDLLDVMLNERYLRQHWKVRIDGIEVFGDYIQDHQRAIYDHIFIGDAFDVMDRLSTYDMVILGDVLEHFPKERALEFLDKCIAHADKNLAVFIPLGKTWKQPAIYGNPYETHRSSWFFDDFKPFSCCHALFDYSAGPYGAFLVNKDDYITYKIEQYIATPRPTGNGPNPLRERFALSREAVSRIDLRPLSSHVANAEHLRYFSDTDFMEHYRLIAHLSTCFDNSLIFDVGTNKGYSALALSFNPSNRVVSYDIVECKELRHPERLDRIEYQVGDVLSDPRLLSSSLIMLDTNHDGAFERRFYQFLRASHYRGFLFLDDIHLNKAMIGFWNDIAEPKQDLTDLGHYSGSGLVAFVDR
jgi:SAM-dependent methyltransferase